MNEYGEADLQRCSLCELSLHDECLLPTQKDESWACCCGQVDWSAPFGAPKSKGASSGTVGGQVKDPAEMDDARSAGRKRAAMIAPIFTDMVCEWAYLKFAGGGVVPIVGCPGHLLVGQTKAGDGGDLHHGPDKNTLNNTPGINLHRICKSCHHTWHGLNDRFYDGERPEGDRQWLPNVEFLPHNALTRATDEEIAAAASTREAINRREGDPGVAETLVLL